MGLNPFGGHMAMAKKKESKVECVVPGCDTPGCADPAHTRANAQDAAQSDAAPIDEDPTTMKDLTDASIEKAFNALVEHTRADIAPYKPTIAMLNESISRLDNVCEGKVGMEIATLDTLRRYNLNRGGSPIPPYCILNIYDARLLVRVNENNTIDCYRGNINKVQAEIQHLDQNDFWYTAAGGAGSAKFFRYDLTSQEDSTIFINSILRIAATCKASSELGIYDIKPSDVARSLGKPKVSGR